jgi:hypothetical protein
MTKLDPKQVAMIVDHYSLHDKPQDEVESDIVEEDKPILQAASDELTKSKFLSLFNEELKTISSRGHPPQHLNGRVGEAKNPGPDLFDTEVELPN